MARANKAHGRPTRKRRPSRAAQATGTVAPAPPRRGGDRSPAGRPGGFKTPLSVSYGERPPPPWDPVPLSELVILAGAVAFVVGLVKAYQHETLQSGALPLLVGLALVLLGTLEVTLREHLSGYRSHAVLLTALPVLVFHSAVVLGVSSYTRFPELLNIALFAIDIALFFVLFKVFRRRFLDARTRRVSGR